MGITRDVIDRAARQGGVIIRSQLLEMGHSPASIDWLVRSQVITTIGSGTYRIMPPKDDVDLVRGAVVALPNATVSHQSAAHLLRFPRLPKLVPTVVVASHTTHRFPGVTVRRCDDLIRSDIVYIEGLPVTTTPRTLFDLAGALTFREFDAIGESLVIADRLDLTQFTEMSDRLSRKGKPGSRAAKDFLAMRAGGDPRATVLERKGRAVMSAAGLPAPIAQYPIPWDPRRRFDDAYPGYKIAIEWDSRAWHGQHVAMTSDRRRDRGAAAHSWVLLRVTWEDIRDQPDEIVRTIATLLEERRAG